MIPSISKAGRPATTRWLPIGILVLLAVLPYANSLWGEFHFDDTASIVDNPKICTLSGVLGERLPRLLTRFTFFVDYKLGGLSDMPVWHATNIALHACCVLAFYWAITLLVRGAPWHGRPAHERVQPVRARVAGVTRTGREAGPASPPAGHPTWLQYVPFLAAAIFAVHPLASEPVNYIQARAVILYSIFSWLAMCGAAIVHQSFQVRREVAQPFQAVAQQGPSAKAQPGKAVLPANVAGVSPARARIAGAALCVGSMLLAAMSKEVGVFFAFAMVALYALVVAAPRVRNKRRFWISSAVVAAVVLAGAAAWLATGNVWRDVARRFGGDFWSHFWAQAMIFWQYMGLAAWPAPSALNVDHYVYPYLFVHYSPLEPAIALSLAAMALLLLAPAIWLIVRKSWLALPLLLLPVGLAPYFFIPAVEMMVEYRFYLPLAAFCVLAAAALSRALAAAGPYADTGAKASVWITAAIICLPLIAATAWRNAAWRTDVSLWEDAAAKVPRKARAVNALALALSRDKYHPDPPRALILAEQSFDSRYVDTWPHTDLGKGPMLDTLAEVDCAYARWCAAGPRPDLRAARHYFDEAIAVESNVLTNSRLAPNQTQGDPAFYKRQLETFKAARDQTLGHAAASGPASSPAR
jgi:hypothetical protein